MTQEFNETRTGLANNFAAAGADLLAYMGSAAALAAIPDTEPPRYVVAGALADIVKLLPAAEVIRPDIATTAGEQAEPLSDERIIDLARLEGDETSHGFIFNKGSGFSVISFARAIERELCIVPSAAAPAGLDERERFIWQMGYNAAAPAAPEQVQAAPYAYEQDNGADTELVYAAWFEHGYGKMDPECIYRPLYLAAPIAAAPAAPEQMPAGLVHVGTLSVYEDKDATFGHAYDISTNMAGHKALQLLDGAELYATKPGAAAPAAEEVRDTALLDALDAWVKQNREGGHYNFVFAFDTESTARDQIAADDEIQVHMKRAASTEGEARDA